MYYFPQIKTFFKNEKSTASGEDDDTRAEPRLTATCQPDSTPRQGLLPATHTTSCYLPFLNKQGDCEVSGYSKRKTQLRLHTSLTPNWLVTQGQRENLPEIHPEKS